MNPSWATGRRLAFGWWPTQGRPGLMIRNLTGGRPGSPQSVLAGAQMIAPGPAAAGGQITANGSAVLTVAVAANANTDIIKNAMRKNLLFIISSSCFVWSLVA
jgi:hypothetical protein